MPVHPRTTTACSLIPGFAAAAIAPAALAGTIGGAVFLDHNRNGEQDADEAPAIGSQVELIDRDGAVVDSQSIGQDGRYRFTGLVPGPYVVRQVVPTGYVQTAPGFRTTFKGGPVTSAWDWDEHDGDAKAGPRQWSQIAPDAGGAFQSPVDIPWDRAIDLRDVLTIHYPAAAPEKIFNNGHTIEAEFHASPEHQYVEAGGQRYALAQFHLHSKSENAVDGRLADAEAHFVHRHADGGLTVVGVLLTRGQHHPEWDKVLGVLDADLDEAGEEDHHPATIDLASLLPADRHGVFWEGSLTTPPASEPVNWFVLTTPVEVSATQILAFREVGLANEFYPNNRPLQPLNGRQFNEQNHEVVLGEGDVTADFGIAERQAPGVQTAEVHE